MNHLTEKTTSSTLRFYRKTEWDIAGVVAASVCDAAWGPVPVDIGWRRRYRRRRQYDANFVCVKTLGQQPQAESLDQ